MTKIGRNDLCFCGSGKKYKKCHMGTSEISKDMLLRQVRTAREGLISKLLSHVEKIYDPAAINEAWEEWCIWEDHGAFNPRSEEMSVFLPWFLYNWIAYPEDENEVCPEAQYNMPVSLSYLEKWHGNLNPIEREFLESASKENFSFHEVVECTPGNGFIVRDILTGRDFDVIERSASETALKGDIIFARIVQARGIAIMDACPLFLIPPEWKGPILGLRAQFKGKGDYLATEDLFEFDVEIREVYWHIKENLFNPRPPEMCNTDGDPISFHRLIYDVTAMEPLVARLSKLNFAETTAGILGDAERDSDGKVLKVEFDWLKKGNKRIKEWDNTVMGRLIFERNRLTIEVNSARRAETIKKKVKNLAGQLVRYKTTVIEPLEAKIKGINEARPKIYDDKRMQNEDLNDRPEIKEALREFTRKHMEGWIYMRLPALNNRTPAEAVKDSEGREMVSALLTQFERHAMKKNDVDFELALLREIRVKLGLEGA